MHVAGSTSASHVQIEMDALVSDIRKENEGFEEPSETDTTLINYIVTNSSIGYEGFLFYKKCVFKDAIRSNVRGYHYISALYSKSDHIGKY